MAKFLLITDLDNTLVGDRHALEQLNQALMKARQSQALLLVYSTGRSLASYKRLRAKEPLLVPDALVTSVGTEIYYGGSTTPDPDWSAKLDQGWQRDDVLSITAHFNDLVLQPEADQGPYKVSFYLSSTLATDLLPRLEVALHIRGLDVQVVYSGGKDLDILPLQGNKGHAMQFLGHQFQVSPEQTVACGDSGNDQSFFRAGQERGIIVGNARPELLTWYQESAADHHYLAKANCAGGILEGLRHFGFLA
ncbi:sucrose-phosphate phosphatase [Acaryochloris sp. IP29b_bin.148]|uniref:sucrose-phosphate phosphatase n=1 Tax=Acaryochloris sp. IP29b_bin.148 TaxID=2969218 RepID=UPI003452B7E1